MSRFKKCGMPHCTGLVSRGNPKRLVFRSTDEGFNHSYHPVPNDGICQHCGDRVHVKSKTMKVNVCNACYNEYHESLLDYIVEDKAFASAIQSFNSRKSTVLFSAEQISSKT